tara:strand:+ start:224 stop:469 length:246 start_codon:yes stop_codon:yes gene_type:complete
MISALTKAHTNALPSPANVDTLDTLEDLQDIMITVGSVFAGLAFLSAIGKVKYRGVEGKSPEDVEDDITKMLREKARLLQV